MFENNIVDYLGLNKTAGDVGIEIEMETKAPLPYMPESFIEQWLIELDGSLRGHGRELVLRTPCDYKQATKVMKKLRGDLVKHSVEIMPTIRAGVHIHINMQKHCIGDIYKLMSCYYPMETVLAKFCGDGREGNLFCLRARDAEFALRRAEASVQEKDFYLLRTQELRYSAMNLQSLFNYGSVEFRALGTTKDLKNIDTWIDILWRLKEYSLGIPNCWDNISMISGMGPRNWMLQIFGPELFKILDYPELEEDVTNDMRQVQFLSALLKDEGV